MTGAGSALISLFFLLFFSVGMTSLIVHSSSEPYNINIIAPVLFCTYHKNLGGHRR